MDRRTLLKLLGGVAALPALAKLIKGKSAIKATKAVGKVLPKVEGMPDWFSPLVNKIMKEGVDISPKASRIEDMVTVKKLEIPSETGKLEVITLTENKITGNITIESNYGGVADSPFELSYRPPKTDIDATTGKVIKEPGDFSVIENRPKPDYNDIGNIEFDYDNFDIDSAYSDLERLEKIGTGKIKNTKKAAERASGREMIEKSPYDDIMNRYPDPDINDPYDYANGGLASFANGGKARKKSKAEEPLSKYKSYSEQELLENIEAKLPNQLQSFSLEDYLLNTMPMFEPRDVAPPRSYSPTPNIYDTQRQYQVDLADGGVASMFRERPRYQVGGTVNSFNLIQRPDDLGLPGEENLTEETLEQAMARGVIFYDPITGRQINRVGTREVGFGPNFIAQRAMQAQQDAAARTLRINIPSVATPSNFLSPYQSMQQEILTRLQSIPTGGTTVSVSEGSSGISPLFRINRAIQAEQEAAARVTPTRMADGGLTKTVPPVRGPISQGVESLFRRRYN
jgi:hypothetical protein